MRRRPLDASTRTPVTPLWRSALLILGSHDVAATAQTTDRSTSPARDGTTLLTHERPITEGVQMAIARHADADGSALPGAFRHPPSDSALGKDALTADC
jgi:hypothetical protein